MSNLTHWKKVSNPNYLGSYAFQPGEEMIVTIKEVKESKITGQDGKSELGRVAYFVEDVKPMILNATNCKTIAKIYGTSYMEHWNGRKIQLYVDAIRAFGEIVEAVRIRPIIPAISNYTGKCADCGRPITDAMDKKALEISKGTYNKYGKELCVECAMKVKAVTEVTDPRELIKKKKNS